MIHCQVFTALAYNSVLLFFSSKFLLVSPTIAMLVITGEFCERKIHFCDDFNPCQNGANCVNQENDFV